MSNKKIGNNKILTFVLLIGIASTGFSGISSANSNKAISGNISSMEEGVKKSAHNGNHFGKRKGFGGLTDDEKAALESMSDDEKKAFFIAKKETMMAEKEASKAVIDKLINGESLTSAEETIRLELLARMEDTGSNHKGRGNGEGREIIAKILAGDELSADEETQLADMQGKYAEREAQRAIVTPIIEKKKAGEELTSEEQNVLDDHIANKPQKKGHTTGKGHNRKGERGDRK